MKKILFSLFLFSFAIVITSCGNSENKVDETKNSTELKAEVFKFEETVEINGVKHFIKKIGKGEPLLVLHGGPGLFHDYLTPHFEKLAKDYQIIFYDQRGCGRTEFPQDTSSINIKNYVEDLDAIIAYLKIDRVNLIGHSWGALLAINYTKKYPQNLHRLVLVSPPPATTDYFDETFSNMQAKRSEEDTKELVQTMMSAEFEKRDEKIFKKAILIGDKVNLVNQKSISKLYEPMTFNKTSANSLMLVNSLLERTFFNLNIVVGLDKVKCPTLIITGDLDNVPFESTQSIHENIKGSKLEIIKRSCHYPFFETPKKFNKIIRNFLDPEYE